MTSLTLLVSHCIAAISILSSHKNGLSPVARSGVSTSTLALHLFGRKSHYSKQQVTEPISTVKKELKITELNQVGEFICCSSQGHFFLHPYNPRGSTCCTQSLG
jgi:hypothetical protein